VSATKVGKKAQRFGIRAIPTRLVFRGGRETGRHAGVLSREQLDTLVGLGEHA